MVLNPFVVLFQVHGKLAVTLVTSKDDLPDSPRVELGSFSAAPLKSVLLHHVVTEHHHIRATNVLTIDIDCVIPCVLWIFNFKIQALPCFQRSQEVPGLNFVVGVSIRKDFRENIPVFVRRLLNRNIGPLLVIENITKPKTRLANFIVPEEDVSPVVHILVRSEC